MFRLYSLLCLLVLSTLVRSVPTPQVNSDSYEEEGWAMESATEKQDPAENHCDAVCGLDDFTEAGEKEALCSIQGLRVTLACAQCIDTTWPDTTWEDSAMAEYENILRACEVRDEQEVFRLDDNL